MPYPNLLNVVNFFLSSFIVSQSLKVPLWCFTQQQQIPLIATTTCIIMFPLMVGFIRSSCYFPSCSPFLKLQKHFTFLGTRNVIQACMEHKVQKLIYTSSASVVFDGTQDLKNIDESFPYPEKVTNNCESMWYK